jgi:hypothetical protein
MGLLADLAIGLFGNSVLGALTKNRKQESGSPVYTWNVGAIPASGSVSIDPNVSFPRSRAYAPLDSIVVINNDVVDVQLTINGKETFYIPAGAIQPVSGELGLTHLTLTNLDAGTPVSAGKIYANLQKSPKDIDDLARELI